MKSFIYKCFIGGSVALSMTLSSCLGDLDLKPIDDNVIQLSDFKDNPQYYTQLLAKVYAGLAVSGQEGPAGNPDIQGFDEGQAQYLRAYWNLQELPTDEAVLGWNDAGLPELSMSTWSAANGFVYVMYSRVFFQIALCNDFLRNTTPTALAANDVPEDVAAQIQTYRAEARVLRALSYWHAIDLFGAVSFVTEENKIMEAPKQKSRAEIYQFILDELNAVEESIPLQPQYGRVGRDAVNMIRAKLYLNAAVYTGTPQYGLCAAECEKIIARHNTGTNHGLAETYKYLFGGDNDRYARGGNESEILMTVPFDSDSIRSYGGTMYLTVGSYGGKISARNYGVNDAWAGPRSTSTLVLSFSPQDERYAFFSEGASINNTNLSTYQDGYSVVKFTNLLSTDWDNAAGRAESYPDTDFPLFRLADVYLMYAECAYRGAADRETGRTYMNYLRDRAGMPQYDSVDDITLDEILQERMRELYWEGHRRTDLIRFEKFTSGNYLWPWKGGVYAGKSLDTKYNLYPIPAKEIAANPAYNKTMATNGKKRQNYEIFFY